MDRYEYKLKLDQLKDYAEQKNYQAAADLADSINWNKVRNVNTLCLVGDVYEQLERLTDAKQIYEIAYERSKNSRSALYRLAKLAVRMGDVKEAESFYNEFLGAAPKSNARYVLAYQIACLKDRPISERIALLEDMKKNEYSEEWGYELAYLYYEAGMPEACVAQCDELILWFGDGEFVRRALELKRVYQPLSPTQEELYKRLALEQKKEQAAPEVSEAKPAADGGEAAAEETVPEEENTRDMEKEMGQEPLLSDTQDLSNVITEPLPKIKIPSDDVEAEKFNTINLQAELAKSIREIEAADDKQAVEEAIGTIRKMSENIPGMEDITQELRIKNASSERTDDSLMENYQKLLEEEEAQEEASVKEETAPLSIEQVLADWEKTKRAAQEAIRIAEEEKLEMAKRDALGEADQIMKRLNDLIPLLQTEVVPEKTGNIPVAAIAEAMDEAEASLDEELPQPEEEQTVQAETAPAATAEEPADVPMTEEELLAAAEAAATSELAMDLQAEEGMIHTTQELPEVKPHTNRQPAAPLTPEPVNADDIWPTAPISFADELPEIKDPEEVAAEGEDGDTFVKLTDEQKELFSYFLPVPGMEEQICQTILGVISRTGKAVTSLTGNILIQGEEGSGKTVLATSLIKVIEETLGNKDAKIGKISAASLNHKNINALIPKVAGGYLIIDKAGDLERDTVLRLSKAMESNTQGLVVLLEDTRAGIRHALSLDYGFAKKFTEKINIPLFTIDELVSFGKSYANEMECELDEMAVLALYNRIGSIQKLEHATMLSEVKDIIDKAIESAENATMKKAFGSIFAKRYTDDDFLILHETDFAE